VSVGVYVADILFPPEKWSPCKADMTQSLGPGDQHIPGKASKTIIPNHLAQCFAPLKPATQKQDQMYNLAVFN
jgi:hypothetical protein